MLEIRSLHKTFRDFQVLRDISLSAPKGKIYGLVGSNGCGKTTLLKHMVQIYKQDQGDIFYDGQLISKNDPRFSDFYFVQDDLFFPYGSTLQSLFDYEALLYPQMSMEKMIRLSDFFSVDRQKKLSSMSKGQKKQAAFVLAMSANPKILLLDEIVDGLDAVVRRKFWSVLLKEMAEQDMTVILSSHDLKELDNISDRIGIMHNGTIIKEEDMETMKENMKRFQFAVDGEYQEINSDTFQILKTVKVGSVYFVTMQGNTEEFENQLRNTYQVLLFNELAVNLEEIFITELGGSGYGTEDSDI